jgi:hypothetical protein
VTDLELAQVDPIPSNGLGAQDIAMLGAMLTSAGLTRLQVQGLIGRVQKVAMKVTLDTLSETLEDIRQIQEARLWRIIQMVRTLPVMAGYVNRDRVVQIVQQVAAETPRQ